MALTKYDIASAGLILVGAEPVTTFANADGSSSEQKVCFHLYQTLVDHWLSVFPWRFATTTVQLSREAAAPETKWQASYIQPANMKALQVIYTNVPGNTIEYDRFENRILCNATAEDKVYAVYTYEPPIAWWPGYFVTLIETALAERFSFALAGKIDLKVDYAKATERFFMLAKNADSRQQTTRKLRLTGRRSIMEARRGG